MTYREPVRHCIYCWQPWNGFGFMCNECARLEAIKEQTGVIRETAGLTSDGSDSYSSGGGGYYDGDYSSGGSHQGGNRVTTSTIIVYWIIIIFIASLGNWFLLKFFWIGLKAGVYLMFGWWMGFDIDDFF